ncbi:hypothetical protein VTN49DRAFT_7877 [Thermomyces lanuginosus]|uniref:uncharacterized protein n=1 Tax=Thermomyces lanuginosus TaxID=5541 RepID=UPI003743EAE4
MGIRLQGPSGMGETIEARRQRENKKAPRRQSKTIEPAGRRLIKKLVTGQGATQAWDTVEGDARQQLPTILQIGSWAVSSTGNTTAVPFREDKRWLPATPGTVRWQRKGMMIPTSKQSANT